MNEENNKKRNKIIIIVAVLFLLTAGIITVYSFKDTKAEEIESFIVNSDLVVLPPFYKLMDRSYSGIELKTSIKSSSDMSFYYRNTKGSIEYYDELDSIELQDVYCTFDDSISASLVDTISRIRLKNGTYINVSRPWYLYDKGSENKICENDYCCKATIKDYPISYVSETSDDYLNFYIYGASYTDIKDTAVFIYVKERTGNIVIQTGDETYPLFGKNRDRVLKQTTDGSIYFNRSMVSVTLDGNGGLFANSKSMETMTFIQKTSVSESSKLMIFETVVPERDNYKFVGWEPSIERNDVTFDSENPKKVKFSLQTACGEHCYRGDLSLKAVWEKEESHPRQYTLTYLDSDGKNIKSVIDPLNTFEVIPGSDIYCTGNYVGGTFQYWKNTDTSDTDKYGNCRDCNGAFTITSGRNATLKAVCSSNSGGGDTPNHYSVYYKDSIGYNTVYTKTHSSSNFTIIKGENDYCVGTDANKIFSYWKNMTDTSDTKKYCLDTTSGCTESIPIPSGKTYVTLKAVCSSNSGGGSTPKYTLTLKKNCSDTFKCVSDTNSEVCNQLKNNGKFTKIIAKGDTFTFPKTFDTLTCDGNEINSWGSFELGQELEIKSDITASAKWKSSSGGGDTPSTDEYTVTLKKNCSGTFKCVSDTNSEVCNQLKNNGNFTKSVTKGDTFIFPKTFDTLTCDGNEINSWGNFELGQELEINSNITASAKWKSSSGGGDTPSTDEYTVTLKKNCSGTFKCVSDKNSEVCNQLKNNGKFTKNVTKGDTFIFPKTFDTLTCDGENIDKWGIYNLGSSITVNSNITTSANWKNSSSNDDPIDDPIDNPQTGSIVIYLVLLFGIGALAYSVWYFRGFRKN